MLSAEIRNGKTGVMVFMRNLDPGFERVPMQNILTV